MIFWSTKSCLWNLSENSYKAYRVLRLEDLPMGCYDWRAFRNYSGNSISSDLFGISFPAPSVILVVIVLDIPFIMEGQGTRISLAIPPAFYSGIYPATPAEIFPEIPLTISSRIYPMIPSCIPMMISLRIPTRFSLAIPPGIPSSDSDSTRNRSRQFIQEFPRQLLQSFSNKKRILANRPSEIAIENLFFLQNNPSNLPNVSSNSFSNCTRDLSRSSTGNSDILYQISSVTSLSLSINQLRSSITPTSPSVNSLKDTATISTEHLSSVK